MAWTTVITHNTGDVFPASDWNTYVRDNFAYLHGDAGGIQLVSGLNIRSSGSTVGTRAELEISNLVAGRTATWLVDDTGVARFEFTGTLANIITVDSSGVVKTGAALMRLHRHPYANDRHIESGTLSVATGAGSSITFTDAYSAAPNVAVAGASITLPIAVTAVSTTGATLQHNGGSALTAYWHAEGPD